ncbi:hypothetical protein H0H93_005177 [Arthromyces matolae]|nr:hypothetical protein H0H93_005177 [Arthromyces matolae]
MPCRLDQSTHVRQLVTAIRDAAVAHSRAVAVAEVLHHDISVENIMFKVDENANVFGYLIDWDLFLHLGRATSEAQLERAGTWQFTAARLLERPRNKEPLIHNRVDDVESFFHVTHWLALRFTPHSMDGSDLAQSLHENFDNSYVHPGITASGHVYLTKQRASNLVSGALVSGPGFLNQGIDEVLYSMHLVLCQRYKIVKARMRALRPFQWDREEHVKALRNLDDPHWLPTLLTDHLDDHEIDWESNSGFVKHTLVLLADGQQAET